MGNSIFAIITGYVGRDPAFKYTQNGSAVADFSIAVTKKRGDNETTRWYRVTVWGKTAELVNQYVRKGDLVQVMADDISASAYTNKQDEQVATVEVTGRDIVFLHTNRERQEEQPQEDVPF